MLLLSDPLNSISNGIVLNLRNWDKSLYDFFEIRVMLSSEREGVNGNVSINAAGSSIPGGWTELGLGHSNSTPAIHSIVDNTGLEGRMNAQYDTWYTLRIEFRPETRTFTYLVNGQILNTYVVPGSDAISFKPELQVWHENDTSVKVFVDEVRIGQ